MVELFREDPDEDLGLRIVGGKDTPLGNIVIQEIMRDSLVARDGKLAPGDHILEVRHISARHAVRCLDVFHWFYLSESVFLSSSHVVSVHTPASLCLHCSHIPG